MTTNDVYEAAKEAERLLTNKRWCSQCQSSKPPADGSWKISPSGNHKRWMCKDCTIRRKDRERR